MWSDNETGTDFLGFQHLADGVLSIVKNDALLPATIGVFGDWGSGKSSLLRMVGDRLRSEGDALVLDFNGWLFEDYGDARAALMGSILDAVVEDAPLAPQAQRLAAKLLKRVNWWRVLGAATKASVGFALAGPAGAGIAVGPDLAQVSREFLARTPTVSDEEVAKYLAESPEREERKSIREFREDFAKLLSQSRRKRLVVIIDDLDRCLPDTIIATLEAIKLFLFVDRWRG
jgi:predicted KAP-like P-loop ATPase